MHISVQLNSAPTHIINLELQNRVKIPLFEFNHGTLLIGSKEHQKVITHDLTDARTNDPNCVRRNFPTTCYNCHGLTFASRRGWLSDADIVLKNEGSSYRELSSTEKIIQGDIICYYDSTIVSHTGIIVDGNSYVYNQISPTGSNSIVILSKWGSRGEFLHDHNKSPYGQIFKIFRYIRTSY